MKQRKPTQPNGQPPKVPDDGKGPGLLDRLFDQTHPLLLCVGVILVAAALTGYFRNQDDGEKGVTTAILLTLGTFIILMAAFHTRLEGRQNLPFRTSVNLCSRSAPRGFAEIYGETEEVTINREFETLEEVLQ